MPQVKVIQPLSEPSKKLRVAAYARVSSDSADQLNSFATQVDYYTGYIQSKDEWEFAGLYADEAISGITADKRSDFQRLLVDCHAGKIDRILVKSISRFARNTLDCIQTVRELKQLNIPVEFEKENIDTGSMGSEIHEHLSDWDGECASYTEISGELYWVSTGRFWVVDVPAQEEKGHWGYK